MNIKILKTAVEYSISQLKTCKIKLNCTEADCGQCLVCAPETDELKELIEAKRWLELVEHQQKLSTSWQHLNNLDNALLQLYKHCEFDASTEEGFLLELNGQPFILDFNPAAFADLQRLLHRQIAINYSDDIE